MKQMIENIITDGLTITYKVPEALTPIIWKPDVEYNEEDKTIYIKPSLPPYRMVVLKRLIYNYGMPIDNIIVGTPDVR